MQGNINFTGSLDGLISGGGDGSVVTITPTYDSGTKVADYTIDTVPGSIYVPASDSAVTDVKVNMENPANWVSVVNGAGVAEVNFWTFMENVVAPFVWQRIQYFITMDDVNTALTGYQKQMIPYGPGLSIYGTDHNEISLTFDIGDYLTISDAVATYQRALTSGRGISLDPYTDTIYTSFDINDYLTTTDAAATYQEKLIAGTNITIDPDTNVISATGGGGGGLINYVSDTKIGTWDGGDLYQAELNLDVRNGRTFDLSSLNISKIREISAYEEDVSNDYIIKIPYYESNNYWAYYQYRNTTHELVFIGSNNNYTSYPFIRVIIEYKKSV